MTTYIQGPAGFLPLLTEGVCVRGWSHSALRDAAPSNPEDHPLSDTRSTEEMKCAPAVTILSVKVPPTFLNFKDNT